MTPWEFAACIEGVNRANGGKEAAPDMSDDDYDALVALGEKWSAENGQSDAP